MGNLVKVEGKHYAPGSRLNLRELEGELVQAARSGPGVDLWVLATSTRMLDQHTEKLEASAHELDVEVLFLDMGNDGLPRLAVLMAAFQQELEAWADLHGIMVSAAVKEALEAVLAHACFTAALEQIQGKLNSTLLGYEDACRRAKRRFLSVMADRGDSIACFNQDVALRAHGVRPIGRPAIAAAFDTWWSGASQPPRHTVALGEEGVGKTWVAMAWAHAKAEANQLPLFVPFNAYVSGITDSESLEAFLPRLLAEWTEIGTAESWRGRLRRWFAMPSAEAIIVLLADGLNERPNVNWPTFFRTLEDSRWRNTMRIIATDRPGHWKPNCAMAGLAGFQEVTVGGYSDAELRKALQETTIQLSRIPSLLQALIRKPRYCKLVAEHFEEMNREGDMSVERLIFLDNRHRFQEKRGLALNTVEFVDVIRRLAEKYRERPHLTGRDIQDLVPRQDSDGRVHQEIIDGGLLVPRENSPGTFTVERTRLVYGLGMLLGDDIGTASQRSSGPELRERIASWFEPHPEMELKVAICASALFHALTDADYSQVARRELLRYWLTLRNWADEWHDTTLQCIARCPDDFVWIAEEFWQSAHDQRPAQELLARAFTKYRDHPSVQPVLVAAVERWMGFINRSGHPVLRHDAEHTRRAEERIAARLGGLPAANTEVMVTGERLFVIEHDGWSRLPRLGLLVISAGPRVPFVRAFVRWSLAAAVMGGAMEYSEAAWVCRLAEDDLETPSLAEVQRLINLQDPLARTAAHTLLECLGTARARALGLAHPLPESERQRKLREQREADPCRAWGPWSDEDCRTCMERRDLAPGIVVRKLGSRVMDSGFDVSPVLLSRTAQLLAAINPETLRAHMGHTSEDHAVEEVWPLLVSRNPVVLADYLRSVVRTLPARQPLGKRFLAFWLEEFAFILRREDLEIISRAIDEARQELQAQTAEDRESEAKTIEAYLFYSLIGHLNGAERLRALLSRPDHAYDLMDLQIWFEPLSGEETRAALDSLRATSDPRRIFRTLWFLAYSRMALTEADRDLLLSFMKSDDALVRGACMRFACYVNDGELGRHIVDLGRTYASADLPWETHWGVAVLYLFSAHLPFATAASRMHPALAGRLVVNRGNRPEELDLYAATLDRGWEAVIASTHPDLAGLPIVMARKLTTRPENDLPEFREEEQSGVRFVNWTSTWGAGAPPKQSLAEAFRAMQEDPSPRLNAAARERVEWLMTAWTTPAFDWFGREFDRDALVAIYDCRPELFQRWTAAALVDGVDGRKIRLRLGNLLVDVCAVLLNREPARGAQLWSVLRKERAVPIQFNMLWEAFRASDSSEVDAVRQEELDACINDRDLSHLAYVAEMKGRSSWLRNAIDALIGSPVLWRRAKGLMLASYSNISATEFEELVARANVAGNWIEKLLEAMRENVRSNELAQTWYARYFGETDLDKAWGAYEAMLQWGDTRFDTWRESIESRGAVETARRLRFVNSAWQSRKRAFDRRDKRKENFLGQSISQGQIFPFVNF
jgi:hypothetical protein